MVLLLSLIQAWGRGFPAHVAHTNAATCERVLSCWTPLLKHHLLRLVGALYVGPSQLHVAYLQPSSQRACA